MQLGFPAALATLIRCPHDGGQLQLERRAALVSDHIRNGSLACTISGHRYHITNGILRMLEQECLHIESRHEMVLREEISKTIGVGELDEGDNIEMRPTLAALRAHRGHVLLELGCGSGRYTCVLAESCRAIVAVDFDAVALGLLAERLHPEAAVAIVQADITRLALTSGSFQRALSTLVSNLPTREHRLQMYRVVADGLGGGGRFVCSAHRHGIRERALGTPKSGRYSESGIFRYYLSRREMKREAGPYFDRLRVRPIQLGVPFAWLLPPSSTKLAPLADRIPVLNRWGQLLLMTAERPARVPLEGQAPEVNSLVRALLRLYRAMSRTLRRSPIVGPVVGGILGDGGGLGGVLGAGGLVGGSFL